MREFLLILSMSLIGLFASAKQDAIKYHEMPITYSSFVYRCELWPSGDIVYTKKSAVEYLVKNGLNCNTTRRMLKIFSIGKKGLIWGYSDSIVIATRIPTYIAEKIQKQYKIPNLKPDEIQAYIGPILEKIFDLQSVSSRRISNNILSKYNLIDSLYTRAAKLGEENKVVLKNNEDVCFLSYSGVCLPNTVGGCDPDICIINCSEKTIKYVHFVCNFYNRVNDILSDEISHESDIRYSLQGPIKYLDISGGSKSNSKFYHVWAERYVVTSIIFEYMDGTTTILNAQQIDTRRITYDEMEKIKKGIYADEISKTLDSIHKLQLFLSNSYKTHNHHLVNKYEDIICVIPENIQAKLHNHSNEYSLW